MPWKWFDDPHSKRENQSVPWLLLVILLSSCVMIIGGVIISQYYFNRILPLDVLLNRAGTDIVVRFPEQPNSHQEEVLINPLISTDGSVTASRLLVTRFGGDAKGYTIPLSAAQWDIWNALRLEWCLHPPPDNPVPEPAFQIGVNCPPTSDARRPRVLFQMPPTALPGSLRALLQAIPSPGCADPLCGW